MNLIPKLRTAEETAKLPSQGNDLQELMAAKMPLVAEKSDEELAEMAKDFSDYPLQQAAHTTLRQRKMARDTRTVEQQYIDAPDSVWH